MAGTREIMIHNFCERLLDNVVHFHIMKMKDSVLIWIGKKAELTSLSVAVCTRYVSVCVVSKASSHQVSNFLKFGTFSSATRGFKEQKKNLFVEFINKV
jgi:hypothetical protein